jgi:hypothetical protein
LSRNGRRTEGGPLRGGADRAAGWTSRSVVAMVR